MSRRVSRCPNCGRKMNKPSGYEKEMRVLGTALRAYQSICLTCVRDWKSDPLAHLRSYLRVREVRS